MPRVFSVTDETLAPLRPQFVVRERLRTPYGFVWQHRCSAVTRASAEAYATNLGVITDPGSLDQWRV